MTKVSIIPCVGEDSLFSKAYNGFYILTPEKKIFLGNKKDRECRFCGKNSKETTFKMKAHIMPEFMGNKKYFSYFECDNCNQYFGQLEDSLFNFAGIFNTLSTIRGKKGFPKFKTKTSDFQAKEFGTIVQKNHDPENEDAFVYDEENERMNINVTMPSYVPHDVYKSLVKIALCMLPDDEFSEYSNTVNWLMSENSTQHKNNPFFNVFRKIGGNPTMFPEPIAVLLRKKICKNTHKMPYYTLLLSYGIISYQIFIPFNNYDNHLANEEDIIFPIEERVVNKIYLDNKLSELGVDMVSLSSIEKKKNEKHKASVGFKITEDFRQNNI
ncbi:HNH endonuclease [Tamlana sp. 2201CG12-4]|uniref:HNH endonuclease n=1 Tax=Tamlana sp. 2201CG12-4 TaxID=3112582 RepID=UPI002DB6D6FE|nr:HNH endonuclease [Tamlana sp. 2201CG12-4]MEC3906439.1 HNH endonuclease [Tamlana sp. 2201CG12-4]